VRVGHEEYGSVAVTGSPRSHGFMLVQRRPHAKARGLQILGNESKKRCGCFGRIKVPQIVHVASEFS